jgi:AcrR family transcriptional regulator
VSSKSQAELSTARRKRERSELIGRIKEVAREMFVRHGYEAVTLDKIAVELEYTRPAIYRYFKDKNDLLISIVLEDMEDLFALLMECNSIVDPMEKLIEMARRYGVWAVHHPNHYLLFYSPAWTAQESAVRTRQGLPLEHEPHTLLFSTINELIAQDRIKTEFADAALLTKTAWACMHGLIMLEIDLCQYDRTLIQDRENSIITSLEGLVKGLAQGFLKP